MTNQAPRIPSIEETFPFVEEQYRKELDRNKELTGIILSLVASFGTSCLTSEQKETVRLLKEKTAPAPDNILSMVRLPA